MKTGLPQRSLCEIARERGYMTPGVTRYRLGRVVDKTTNTDNGVRATIYAGFVASYAVLCSALYGAITS